MPGATDNRIIRMQFENKQFEKNIAKSKKSLDDFKKAMKFEETSSAMTKFAKSANGLQFDTLASNIQKLTDKFTGLGDAGEFVVSRIRASIEGAARSVESFIKSISLEQIAVGQSKYDSLNKAVMTIVATGKHTEEEAYDVFERLMTYTGETSYSFSDMVGQISAFTAAGQNLWASEHAMEGIANASAKAGQGVGQATNAMQIFAKALGRGSLGLEQWQSLNLSAHFITEEFRQTLMDTAVEMGTLTKKADKYYTATGKGKKELVELSNLETTLNKNWATSKVLMATLQKYYFEDIDEPNADWTTFAGTAATAAQRALSLADAINAMKEAVSAGWMTSFRIMFGDLTEAMEAFTNIANRAIESLDRISEWRNLVLRNWSKSGGRDSLLQVFLGDYGKSVETGTYGLMDIIDDAGKTISDAFWDFLKIFKDAVNPGWLWDETPGAKEKWLGVKLAEITKSVSDFFTGIKEFFNTEIAVGNESKTRLELIRDVIRGIIGIMWMGIEAVRGIVSFILNIYAKIKPAIEKVWAFLSDLGTRLYAFAGEFVKNDGFIEFFAELAEIMSPLADAFNIAVGAFTDMLGVLTTAKTEGPDGKTFIEMLGDGIRWIAGVIRDVGMPILDFFTKLFNIFSESFQNGINAESIGEAWNKVVELIKVTFTNGFQGLQDFVGKAVEWLTPIFETIKTFIVEKFNNLMAKVKQNEVIGPIVTWFENTFNSIKTFFTNMFGGGEGNTDFIYSAVEWIKNIYDSIATWFSTIFDNAKNSDILGPIVAWFTSAIESIKTWFANVFNNAKNSETFGPVIEWFSGIYEGVKTFVLGLFDKASDIPIVGSVVNWIRNIFGKIKDAFGKLFGGKEGSEVLGEEIAGTFKGTVANAKKALAKEFGSGTAGGSGAADGPKSILQVIRDWIHNLFESIKNVFSGFTAAFQGEGETLGDRIGKIFKWLDENIGLSRLLLILGGIGAGFLVGKLIWKAVKFFKLLCEGVVRILELIKGTGKSDDEDKAKVPFYKKMMFIAGAIAILTACITALGAMQLGAALQGFGLMAAIMVAIWGLSKLMVKTFKDVKFGEVMGGAISFVAIALAVGRIVKAIQPFSTLSPGQYFQVLGGMFAVVTGLGLLALAVQKTSTVKGNDTRLMSLAGVAFGVAILVKALMPLANMQLPQLATMFGSLIVIVTVLGIFAAVVSKNSITLKDTQMIQIAALAFGIAVLIRALMPLKDLAQPELEKLGMILIAALGIIYAFTRAISATSSSLKDTQMIQIAALALGIAILVKALMPLGSIQDPSAFLKMGASLLVILGLLFAFTLGVSKMKLSLKGSGMLQMIALALSIAVLVFALQPLADMEWERLAKMGVGLVATLGMLALVVAAAKNTTLVGGVGAMLMLVALAGAILAVGAMLHDMKEIDPGVIWAFTIGISAMIISIAASVAILGTLGGGVMAIGGIVALIAAIVLVFGAIALMIPLVAQATGSALTEISGKLVIVADMMSTFANTMSKVDESGIDKGEGIIAKCKNLFTSIRGFKAGNTSSFTTALYELGLGLKFFGEDTSGLQDPDNSPAFKVIDKLVAENDSIKGVHFYDAALQIAYLGAGLELFNAGSKDIDTSNSPGLTFLSSLASMSGGLATIEGLNFEKFKGVVSGLGGALYIYARGAKEVAGIEIGETPDVTAAVTLLNSISQSLTGDNAFKIPTDFPSQTEMAGFGADLAALALALQEFAGASKDLGDGGMYALNTLDFLTEIKRRLTDNEIKVFKIFGDNQISSLVMGGFALDIVLLGGALKGFADSCKGFPKDTSAMTNLLTYMATLRERLMAKDFSLDFLGIFEVKQIKSSTISDFGKDIRNLGQAMSDFASSTTVVDEKTGEIKPVDFSKATEALTAIANIQTLMPDVSGVWQFIAGQTKGLDALAGEIVALGSGLNDFAGKVQGENGTPIFNETAVNAAITTTEKIAELGNRIREKVPVVLGVIPMALAFLFARGKTLTEFGTEMGEFGGDLQKIAEGVRTFMPGEGKAEITQADIDKVSAIVESCIAVVGSVNEKMPRVNIVSSKWVKIYSGVNYDLSTIGTQIGAFGTGIKSLGDGLSAFQPSQDGTKITKQAVTKATGIIDKAVDWLKKLNEKLSEVKGGVELFQNQYGIVLGEGSTISFSTVGENIGKFGTGLQELGSGLGNFKKIKTTTVNTALGAVESAYNMLSDISAKLPPVGGLISIVGTMIYGRASQLTDLGTQLGGLGQGLGAFGTAIQGKFKDAAEVETAIGLFSSVIHMMSELALSASGLSDSNLLLDMDDYSALAEGVGMFLNQLVHFSQGALDYAVFDTVIDIMDHISERVKEVGGIDSTAINSFKTMIDAITGVSTVDVRSEFAPVGEMIDAGVADGITKNEATVINAMTEIATRCKELLMTAWGIASPSKVFAGIGEYAAEGLANGLTDGTDLVANAGDTLANNAVAEAIAALSRIGEEVQPTITPTIDFSQAEADMANYRKTRRGLVLDTSAAAGAATRVVRSVETTTGGANQNEVDLSGIYSRIADLGSKITQLGTQIGNIRVVLDTGVIAGSVTDGVDKNIGTKMFYAGRRN